MGHLLPVECAMKLEKQHTAGAIIVELVRRLAQKRVRLGLTQNEAAERAGVSLRTLRRLELGEDCHFSTIIRVLNAYGLIDRLDQLVPEPMIDPIEFVDDQKRRVRFRVTSKASNRPWKWGDEQ